MSIIVIIAEISYRRHLACIFTLCSRQFTARECGLVSCLRSEEITRHQRKWWGNKFYSRYTVHPALYCCCQCISSRGAYSACTILLWFILSGASLDITETCLTGNICEREREGWRERERERPRSTFMWLPLVLRQKLKAKPWNGVDGPLFSETHLMVERTRICIYIYGCTASDISQITRQTTHAVSYSSCPFLFF